jgi:hypothetical protein
MSTPTGRRLSAKVAPPSLFEVEPDWPRNPKTLERIRVAVESGTVDTLPRPIDP